MADGKAQFARIRAIDGTGNLTPSAKLYHYDAGTASLKNIWQDEDKVTPLAQPFISDSRGNFDFFADGKYKMVIDDSADVNLDTLDDWEITSDDPLIGETNFGTVLPGVGDAKKNKLFALLDGSDNLLSLHYLNGPDGSTKWSRIYATKVQDVTFYGAIGDGITDDTTAVQAAITAVPATGGAVYFPSGTYKITAALTVTNKPIYIYGDGNAVSMINQTGSANCITFATNSTEDSFSIRNIGIHTTASGGGNGIQASFPTVALSTFKNVHIEGIEIGPMRGSGATAHFLKDIAIDDAMNAVIVNVHMRGKDNDISAGTVGIEISAFCKNTIISGCTVYYKEKAYMATGTCEEIRLENNRANYVDHGFWNDLTGAGEIEVVGNIFTSFQRGVNLTTLIPRVNVTGNTLLKYFTSSNNYIGVSGGIQNGVVGNNFIGGAGTGGNEWGILLDVVGTVDVTVTGNTVDLQDQGISTTTDANNCIFVGNRIDGVTSKSITINGDKHVVANNIIENSGVGIEVDDADSAVVMGNLGISATPVIDLTANSTNCLVTGNNGQSGGAQTITSNAGTGNIITNNFPQTSILDSFTDGDTTPSVKDSSGGRGVFATLNTGATTITNLDDGYDGQRVTIKASDANTTIQNNANLVLSAGADLIMGLNDSIALIKVGAWRQIGVSI
jgi:hypothetical protein